MMAAAEARRRRQGTRTIVFVDEIHRFNKAQQDAFLPHVEAGDIVLIGATTENPSFEVNAALLSRSKVFVLKPLDEAAILTILRRALEDEERGLGRDQRPRPATRCSPHVARFANGDARSALNLLAAAASHRRRSRPAVRGLDAALLERTLQRKALLYDKGGEEHYNLISALHKSMRNSDPDAAVYWLARMVEAGEDPDLHRAPAGPLRLRGHRQRRPAGAGGRRRRAGRGALPRLCRKPTPPSPRRRSIWPRRRRATLSTWPTARPPIGAARCRRSRCRCTCATRRRD